MPAQGVECGWKPAGWHVLTLLNSRPPSLPQPPEPTFAAPPKVLPEHHELVVGRGALLNSRIPSLPRPQEPISCSVNEHVFQASRAWYRASVGQARIHTCLGAEAGATMLTNTHTHNTHRLLPPSRLISKIHTQKGCALCRRPRKTKIELKLAFELEFQLRLKVCVFSFHGFVFQVSHRCAIPRPDSQFTFHTSIRMYIYTYLYLYVCFMFHVSICHVPTFHLHVQFQFFNVNFSYFHFHVFNFHVHVQFSVFIFYVSILMCSCFMISFPYSYFSFFMFRVFMF